MTVERVVHAVEWLWLIVKTKKVICKPAHFLFKDNPLVYRTQIFQNYLVSELAEKKLHDTQKLKVHSEGEFEKKKNSV